MMAEDDDEVWRPKTELGRKVVQGRVDDIEAVMDSTEKIREPEIVDQLVPDLEDEVILIGGTPGKGGGKRRIVSKRTVRMHKSGRRFNTKAMVVVGNRNGLVGLGEAHADDTRDAIDKARDNAKLNLIRVRRGNGSWEDTGTEPTTLPFRATGKSGSVEVELQPAPRGTGIAASEGVQKIVELAGIEDLWIRSRGNTRARENHIKAVYNAFKELNKIKTDEQIEKDTGLVRGPV